MRACVTPLVVVVVPAQAAKAALAAAALVPPLEELPSELLQAASQLLDREVQHVRGAMGHADADPQVSQLALAPLSAPFQLSFFPEGRGWQATPCSRAHPTA